MTELSKFWSRRYWQSILGLTARALINTFGLLSMHKAVGKYLPFYLEKNDSAAQRGTLLIAITSTISMGLAIIACTFGFRGLLGDTIVQDPQSIGLLLILVCLVPLQSLDSLLHSTFAVLASPRAIFFRRNILAPLLRLVAVLAIIASSGDVHELAYGYTIAGLIGVITYFSMLRSVLRKIKLIGPNASEGTRINPGEMFRFGLPLLSTDLLWFLKSTVVIITLESLRGTEAVAEYRAVVPLAALNVLILENVRILYMPLAARFVARDDRSSLNQLYAQTSAWITVITFPVFATCVFLAAPVTTILFGDRYTSASSILVALAIGQYFHSILGVNYSTLNAFGKVRIVAVSNLFAAGTALGLQLTLIPRYGALGAGIATGLTFITTALIVQAAMIRSTGVGALRADQAKILAAVAAAIALLAVVANLTSEPWILAPAIAVATIVLIRWSRHSLEIEATFPELTKIPLLGSLLRK